MKKERRQILELKGNVVDIIYRNELNSYTIAVLETEEEETTIVGYLPFINAGDIVKATGNFVEHKDYGTQFKVETFEKMMPDTPEALERYLALGNIKGVGEAIAKRIVTKFGEESLHVLRYDYKRLEQIRGISERKAKEISDTFVENWEVWQIVEFLQRFGIGVEHAKKVYDKFGMSAIEEIEANPYILIEIARGVDYNQIDRMALDLGIEYNDAKRIKSGIKYALIRATYNGNCCVIKENLIDFVENLLQVSVEDIEEKLISLKVEEEIIVEERDEEWVYLQNFYTTELDVAKRIVMIDNEKNKSKIKNIEKELELIEQESEIFLSEKQREAIKALNNHNVTIITGGPGTGKTTIIKTIIDLYNKQKYKTVLCAPTGRAAKKMTETTGYEASTLHRLLEIGKINDDNIYNAKSKTEYRGAPIDADVIVVDEMSMVDLFLMSYLLECVYKGTKLVLVGDSDQLPSVGPGSVLKDLINSKAITTIKLDKIFRQAAKSKIVMNAHRVNRGEGFLSKEEMSNEMNDDFFYIREYSQDKALEELKSLCTGRLKEYGDYDFFQNIQVITPTKKGLLGTRELNKKLQEELNPQDKFKDEKSRGSTIFRVGDRVMQIKNNYEIYWEKEIENEETKEVGSGIFNGEMGTIESIDSQDKTIQIHFDDDKVAWYEPSELEQIEHSYAITIHKAQGSEFDVVLMVIPPSSPKLLTRNLLYTGITRAKKLLIIIGSDKVIGYMIKNVDSKKRNTGLEYRIKELCD